MLRRWSWWRDSVDHSRVNRIGHGDTDTDCDRHADSCSDPHGRSLCGGNVISNPPSDFCGYFSCIASFWTTTNGYVEQCVDGLFSHSGGRSGSCSKHGGNRRPLYGP